MSSSSRQQQQQQQQQQRVHQKEREGKKWWTPIQRHHRHYVRRKKASRFFLASVTRILDVPYGKKGDTVGMPSHHLLEDEDGSNAPLIAGGVRTKKIAAAMVKVDVYVIGLYFMPKACKKHEREDDVLNAVANDSSIAKTVRLTFVRDVSGASVAKAIAQNIEKKLGSKAESGRNEESERKAKEGLEMFKSMFRNVKIEKGASLTFSADEKGTLTTKLRGKRIGEPIKDGRLCGALFGSWCGPDSVIPEMTEAATSILTQALKVIPSEENGGGGARRRNL